MKMLPALFILFFAATGFSQNHEENFTQVKTIEQANSYASSFREVSVSLINAESDVIFFDDIDTSNLAQYVGTSRTFYGRTTKLIKDSMLSIVNVQVISFDLSKTSKETAELLISQMTKRLDNGESFYGVKKKYAHTSASFTSMPEALETVTGTYNIEEKDLELNKRFNWEVVGSKDQIGILIIEKMPHNVPAFYSISYLNLGN